MQGKLKKRYGCISVRTAYLARIEYALGRDGDGKALINGFSSTLNFGYVKDIEKLESIYF